MDELRKRLPEPVSIEPNKVLPTIKRLGDKMKATEGNYFRSKIGTLISKYKKMLIIFILSTILCANVLQLLIDRNKKRVVRVELTFELSNETSPYFSEKELRDYLIGNEIVDGLDDVIMQRSTVKIIAEYQNENVDKYKEEFLDRIEKVKDSRSPQSLKFKEDLHELATLEKRLYSISGSIKENNNLDINSDELNLTQDSKTEKSSEFFENRVLLKSDYRLIQRQMESIQKVFDKTNIKVEIIPQSVQSKILAPHIASITSKAVLSLIAAAAGIILWLTAVIFRENYKIEF